MKKLIQQGEYLGGQCLVAMPLMSDPHFAKAVVYICTHTPAGAMGLVLNRTIDAITFPDLLEQLGIQVTPVCRGIHVHFGGPMEGGRGFVLHSADYMHEATIMVDRHVGLTATIDVLKAIADGHGPRRSILALGYAGWRSGQLDDELRQNVWLTVPPDEELVFGGDLDHKWDQAMTRLGIDSRMLSREFGHA
ncbi:MAG: hypothetical protein FD149_2136 [Rhodospirillaceae bacterium]|nr:MAG: hypothetical protein FD149_2136 [Rhodospirillaceae bacterium]